MTYNQVGEALTVVDPLSRTTNFSYTGTGLVKTVTTPGSAGQGAAVTSFDYDSHGNKTRMINPLGRSTSYTHDDNDCILTATDALGKTSVYAYQQGRLRSTTDPEGFTTTMEYDANDRMISRSNAITAESFMYDSLGNVTTKSTQKGDITYEYDDINRLVAVSMPNKTATFTYDNNNNRVRSHTSDGNGSPLVGSLDVTFAFDNDNRLTRTIKYFDGINVEDCSYVRDGNGNPTWIGYTVKRGFPPRPPYSSPNALYFSFYNTFDNLDRQTRVTRVCGGRSESYNASYDDVGNMVGIQYPDGTTSAREHDNENQVVKVTNHNPVPQPIKPNTVYEYTHDNNGNVTSFSKDPSIPYQAGAKVLEYDELDRLVYDESAMKRYVYSDAGDKVKDILTSTNKEINHIYTDGHRLVRSEPGPGLGMPTMYYDFDNNGNMVRQHSPGSSEAIAHVYSATNRLVARTGYTWGQLSYEECLSHDADDELFFTEERFYHYTSDSLAGARASHTDLPIFTMKNIDPITVQDESLANTRAPQGADHVHLLHMFHGYEGSALRYKSLTTCHKVFSTGTLTVEALYTEFYTYLNGLKVGLTQVAGNGTTPIDHYFSYDGLGSVSQITNNITGFYTMLVYDSYGLESVFAQNSPYQGFLMNASYRGYDRIGYNNTTGEYKTGVRYYSPTTGRFNSPDPFKGYLSEPASQNPYMYCRGNPVKHSDPSGYDFTIGNETSKSINIKFRVYFLMSGVAKSDIGIWASQLESNWNSQGYTSRGKSVTLTVEAHYGNLIEQKGDELRDVNYTFIVARPGATGELLTGAGFFPGATPEQLMHELGHNAGLFRNSGPGLTGEKYYSDQMNNCYDYNNLSRGIMYTTKAGAKFTQGELNTIIDNARGK